MRNIGSNSGISIIPSSRIERGNERVPSLRLVNFFRIVLDRADDNTIRRDFISTYVNPPRTTSRSKEREKREKGERGREKRKQEDSHERADDESGVRKFAYPLKYFLRTRRKYRTISLFELP